MLGDPMGDVKVLLLDEDPALVADLQRGLRERGFLVTALRDGAAGLARAVSQRFDVIVVSAELPGMNGFRVCNRIKKDTSAQSVPVVMTGAVAAELDAHRKLRTRAESYLEKPLRIDELATCIRTVVDEARSEGDITMVLTLDDLTLQEPPPGVRSTPEDRAEMQALLQELDVTRKEVAKHAALRERFAAHEATIARQTKELTAHRAAATKSDAAGKELERVRRELTAARAAAEAEKKKADKRVLEVNKRLEAHRQGVERIHQELIAQKKARLADQEANERTLTAERDAREKERGEARRALQSLAEAKDRSRVQDVERQREEQELRIKSLVRDLEQARRTLAQEREGTSDDRAARAAAEAKLDALETEHDWAVSALSSLLEHERAEAAIAKALTEKAIQAAQNAARVALADEVRAEMRVKVEELERRMAELSASLTRAGQNLDVERRDRLVAECETQERVEAMEVSAAAKEEITNRLTKELEGARREVTELETEIVGLRSELVSVRRHAEEEASNARATAEQLGRNVELLDRARELLEEFAARGAGAGPISSRGPRVDET